MFNIIFKCIVLLLFAFTIITGCVARVHGPEVMIPSPSIIVEPPVVYSHPYPWYGYGWYGYRGYGHRDYGKHRGHWKHGR